MEIETHYLPLHIRSYILAQTEIGEKYDSLVENVYKKYRRIISKGTITKLKAKVQAHGTTADLPKTGRPRIFNEEEKQTLIDRVLEDRKTTAVDLWKDPELNSNQGSVRTIRNILAAEGLFASSRLPVYIPPDSIQERLLFAKKYVKNSDIWLKTIFSDESDIYPYKSGKLYVRCYKGEKDVPRYNLHLKWDPRTVKVWGCISSKGVGPLVRYEKSMDSDLYLTILKQELLKAYPNLRGTATRGGSLIFQHDNAKPHTAIKVEEWLKSQHVQYLEWPPYSPDISPIENLWGILQDELYKYNEILLTSDDVWEKAQKIWYGKLNSYVQEAYKSMPNRIREVLNRNGNRLDG